MAIDKDVVDVIARDKVTFPVARRKIVAPPRLGAVETLAVKWRGRRERSLVGFDEGGRYTSPAIRQWAAQAAAAISAEWRWASGDCGVVEKRLSALLARYDRLMEAGRAALTSERDGDAALGERERAARKERRAQKAGFAESGKLVEEMEPLTSLLRDRVVVAMEKELFIAASFQSKCAAYLSGAGLTLEAGQMPVVGAVASEARGAFFEAHGRFVGITTKEGEIGARIP